MLHDQAIGSLVVKDGKVIGSSLIGQAFTSDNYFHRRPSATTGPIRRTAQDDRCALQRGSVDGINLGPITQKLIDRVKADVDGVARARRKRADPG